MGRPKAVNIKTFPLYNKLHTKKIRMYSGVEITALYPIKENTLYYNSVEVWSHMCGTFRNKKAGFELRVDIPIITNKKTIEFLNDQCWPDWIEKQNNDSDMKEALSYLNRIFPNKEKYYFYELESLISTYCNGTFINYNENGEIVDPTDHDISNRKYYNKKHYRGNHPSEFKDIYTAAYNAMKTGVGEQLLNEYYEKLRDYVYEHHNLNDIFIDIGRNGIVYPVAFTEDTAKWSIKKYGKKIGYAHAGEIIMVVTADKVYFEIKRHY